MGWLERPRKLLTSVNDPDTPASIERLGERAGRQFAALARRGLQLQRPTGQTAATGRRRLGGPALLNRGYCLAAGRRLPPVAAPAEDQDTSVSSSTMPCAFVAGLVPYTGLTIMYLSFVLIGAQPTLQLLSAALLRRRQMPFALLRAQ
jgi:hypothetical protein